jgi:hypothetical protein
MVVTNMGSVTSSGVARRKGTAKYECERCECLVKGGLGWKQVDTGNITVDNIGLGYPGGFEAQMTNDFSNEIAKKEASCALQAFKVN